MNSDVEHVELKLVSALQLDFILEWPYFISKHMKLVKFIQVAYTDNICVFSGT